MVDILDRKGSKVGELRGSFFTPSVSSGGPTVGGFLTFLFLVGVFIYDNYTWSATGNAIIEWHQEMRAKYSGGVRVFAAFFEAIIAYYSFVLIATSVLVVSRFSRSRNHRIKAMICLSAWAIFVYFFGKTIYQWLVAYYVAHGIT